MKFLICISCLLIGHVYGAPSIADPLPLSSSPSSSSSSLSLSESESRNETKSDVEPLPSEQSDASSAAIKIPVDNANKLLYDLDVQVRQLFDDSSMLPLKEEKSEDGSDVVVEDAHSYSAANRELDIYPRQTEQQQQQASLITQLDNLEKRLLATINELQSRRRYFSSTMLRQMYNSVHRIRTNISRIQNQFSSPQVPQTGPTKPAQSGMMQNLQQRVSDLQKAVNDIINRVTSTFQGPNAAKPPGQTMQMVNF